jgi:hypothetical protein
MTNKEEREIDLLELLAKFLVFVKRRYKLILIILIIGTLFGFVKSFFDNNKYENKVIGSSDIIPCNLIYQILNSLNLDYQNNRIVFSKELGISKDISNKILKIEFDTLGFGNNSSFEMKIQSSDSICCNTAKNAILVYLNKNNFISAEYDLIFNQKKQLLFEINQKILELDSLQKYIRISSYKDKNQITVINSYYTEYVTLYEKKQKIEKELQSISKVINIYIDNTGPMKNNVLLKTLLYFIASCLIGIVIASILELKIVLRKYKNGFKD